MIGKCYIIVITHKIVRCFKIIPTIPITFPVIATKPRIKEFIYRFCNIVLL